MSHRLRREILQRIRAMPSRQIQEESAAIIRHLAQWPLLQQSRVVAAFYPTPLEPQLQPLLHTLARTRTLLLPRITGPGLMEFVPVQTLDELHKATFGLMEPPGHLKAWSGEPPHVILVPGVVFGPAGERIGRGGGYYDRYLATCPAQTAVGVAFSVQKTAQAIPQLPHDIRMNYIVCPIGIQKTQYRNPS